MHEINIIMARAGHCLLRYQLISNYPVNRRVYPWRERKSQHTRASSSPASTYLGLRQLASIVLGVLPLERPLPLRISQAAESGDYPVWRRHSLGVSSLSLLAPAAVNGAALFVEWHMR